MDALGSAWVRLATASRRQHEAKQELNAAVVKMHEAREEYRDALAEWASVPQQKAKP
jgi:hypothetical protein